MNNLEGAKLREFFKIITSLSPHVASVIKYNTVFKIKIKILKSKERHLFNPCGEEKNL